MESTDNTIEPACPSPDIAAYVDGELSPASEIELEAHLSRCGACRAELNLQKGFLNALDASLDDGADIPLPKNFTNAVVTNARSSVSGLRRPGELRSAVLISAALSAVAFLVMGSKAESTVAGVLIGIEKFLVVVSSIVHFAYDVSLGSAVVIRSFTSNFIFGSALAVVIVVLVFGVSLYLFSRLLVRPDRS